MATIEATIIVYTGEFGVLSLPIEVTATGGPVTGVISTAIHVTALDSAVYHPSPGERVVWRPVVMVGGVDVSARLIGSVEVEGEEDVARTARFSYAPAAGAVSLDALDDAVVTIDFRCGWAVPGCQPVYLRGVW